MRVISGSAKARVLKAVPGTSTRPTTDKVKEAIFSIVGPYFTEGYVLDLFAGTGALGIEALSRGMEQAVFVDQDHRSIATIKANLSSTGFAHQAEVYRNDAMRALKVLSKRQLTFDLIFVDPPYRFKQIPEWVNAIQSYQLMNPNTQVVVEHDAEDVLEACIGELVQIRKALYGDTAITIYACLPQGTGGESVD
jgi:16S rRNA (guanine966-N2)-methyltransferase